MKKTLLAAALLAGFAGAAQAETSVTLYGVIDTGIAYGKYTDATGQSVTSIGPTWGAQSGSRWGLKGAEDLGGGLQAIFTLESGFDSTNGYSGQGGRLFGRQASVGLTSPTWGQFEIGRMISAPTLLLGDADPFAQGWNLVNIGTIAGSLNTERLDNQLRYVSPSFSGFKFAADYSFGTGDNAPFAGVGTANYATGNYTTPTTTGITSNTALGTNDVTREFALAATYTNGPLWLGAAYTQANGGRRTTAIDITARQEVLAATYDFTVVKLHAAYAHSSEGWLGAGQGATLSSDGTPITLSGLPSFAKGFRANSYMLGFTVPVTATVSVFGDWQHISASKTAAAIAGNGQAMNVFGLGSTYTLSKRTNLYAVAAYTNGYAAVKGQKATDLMVGIRHRF